MIVTVCLNPCIDRTVHIGAFVYGGMNRITSLRDDGSGKGINVALACRELGMEAACIGFMPRVGGECIYERLSKGGCAYEFIDTPGSVRVNTKIVDPDHVITELNQPGDAVGEAALTAMCELVRRWSRRASVMVMTGSLPPGCPADFYKTLMECSQAPCVLDAEGEKLRQGLAAKPFLIKPNRYELELAVGRKLSSPEETIAAAQELIGLGAGMAAVSMGEDGALLTDGRERWYAPRIPIQVLSATGAGDCMVAGMLLAISRGEAPFQILQKGVAGGTAACLTQGTGLLLRKDFDSILAQVHIDRI